MSSIELTQIEVTLNIIEPEQNLPRSELTFRSLQIEYKVVNLFQCVALIICVK